MTKTFNQPANDTIAMRELNPAEVDAVSGGATHKAFDITVAGMHIVGTYSDNGDHATWVSDGKNLEIRGGKV